MAPILQALPSELLVRIFDFLPERQHVSQARLVCRLFHELSSPFLITDVVFALRLDTLKRFREVIDHPYFSRYVANLIYDASRYDDRLASDWRAYVERCRGAPRNMVDQEWLRRKRQDNDLLRDLNIDPDTRCPGAPEPDIDGVDPGGMGRYYEKVYRMGCQRHHPDYYLRYKNQEALEGSSIPHDMLKRAFKACPKLRHVLYTDYRGLARTGESYDACCSRLFDLTLAPDCADDAVSDWHQIADIFELAHEAGAPINTFRLGPHPFVSTQSRSSSRRSWVMAPLMLPVEDLEHCRGETLNILRDSFGRLDTLYLSYQDDLEPRHGAVTLTQLLQPAAQNIKHLSLARAVHGRRGDHDLTSVAGYTAEQHFLSYSFPHLRYLELRHLQLPHLQPLQDFLAAHASTLREVRLVEHNLTDRANEQDQLARWVGGNMHLVGVEVITAADLQALTVKSKAPTQRLTPTWNIAAAEKALLEIEARERLWLGGRPNTLRRSVDVADQERLATHYEEWWLRRSH